MDLHILVCLIDFCKAALWPFVMRGLTLLPVSLIDRNFGRWHRRLRLPSSSAPQCRPAFLTGLAAVVPDAIALGGAALANRCL
jgi:hypothetical protein